MKNLMFLAARKTWMSHFPGPKLRSGSITLLCTIAVALLFARGADAGAASFALSTSGDFATSSTFLALSGRPTYTATAAASAVATGTLVWSGNITGTKLTYAPPSTWTSGTVTAGAAATGPFSSSSSGSVAITGIHLFGGVCKAHVAGTANLNQGTGPGSYATFSARAKDPYSYEMPDLSPIPDGTLLNFSLTLPAFGNIFPPGSSLESWSVTYASYIKDIDTTDVDTFYAANPDLLYSLTLSGSAYGFAVDFVSGSPSGFPVTFSETPSQIDADVLAAIQGGLGSDLTAVSGVIDVSGHTSATIGAEIDIDAEASIPEPATILLFGLGAAMLRKKRS